MCVIVQWVVHMCVIVQWIVRMKCPRSCSGLYVRVCLCGELYICVCGLVCWMCIIYVCLCMGLNIMCL